MKTSNSRVLALASWLAGTLPPGVVRTIYRIHPLASLLRGILNQSAPTERAVVEVAGGDLKGARLLLDLRTEKDYWLGTYEPQLQGTIRELAAPGMTAYDVGANIGYITLLLARRAGSGGQLFAFEALPENLERLTENVALNNLTRQVHIIPAAVVDEDGPVEFFTGASGSMGQAAGSAGREQGDAPAIEVEGISLDSFVYSSQNAAPDLIKLDIEGGEVRALPGAERLLREKSPIILLELHGPESADAAWKILTRCGYRICRMEPGFPEVSALDTLDWKAYVVAVK